jgi:uncharacterized protein (DUF1501 family)
MLTRRQFLQASSLVAIAPTVPAFLSRTASALPAEKDRRVLVVVQLDGGNDALNTVIPYADPVYERLRPKLKIGSNQVLKLNDAVGLHPGLKPLDKLLQAGQLGIIPGVGYPNPNRSHFEGMAIWHTARLDEQGRKEYGWLGRALDPSAGTAYMVGGPVTAALRGRRSTAIALGRIDEACLADKAIAELAAGPATGNDSDLLAFVRRQAVNGCATSRLVAKLAQRSTDANYPSTALGEHLKLIAQLLKADFGPRVFYTIQPGFDTHASQSFTHRTLLSEFAEAVAAFFADLTKGQIAERVVLLAFSEFGRTIKENVSGGTDHGTAEAVFVVGPQVNGGVRGTMPSLADLAGGEPKMTTDFRRIYASILDDWLGLPAAAALGGSFDKLPLIRQA